MHSVFCFPCTHSFCFSCWAVFISTREFSHFYPDSSLKHPTAGERGSSYVVFNCLLGLTHNNWEPRSPERLGYKGLQRLSIKLWPHFKEMDCLVDSLSTKGSPLVGFVLCLGGFIHSSWRQYGSKNLCLCTSPTVWFNQLFRCCYYLLDYTCHKLQCWRDLQAEKSFNELMIWSWNIFCLLMFCMLNISPHNF